MKKTLLILLVSIFGISMGAVAQQYDFSTVVGGNTLFFKITDNVNNHVEVSSELSYSPDSSYPPYYVTQPTGDIIIPDTVVDNGITYNITSIGEAAFNGCDITSIVLPNSITQIGTIAFKSCHSLSSVTLPASLTTIPNSAFMFCLSLTSIDLPSTLETIENFAFAACALTSITLPESITSIGLEAFSSTPMDTVFLNSENLTYCGENDYYAFRNCQNMRTIVIGVYF